MEGLALLCEQKYLHTKTISLKSVTNQQCLISVIISAYPAQFAVISVLGLLLKLLPLFEHFGVREGDSIDPLEGFHVRLSFPVCRRILA